jgi:hypothetical protein
MEKGASGVAALCAAQALADLVGMDMMSFFLG